MNSLQGVHLSQLYLVALVLIFIIYKQVVVKPVKGSRYVITPLVLIYITLNSVDSIKGGLFSARYAIVILVSIGIFTGIISGFITQIFRGEDGVLYQKGGWPALVFLIIIIPIRIMLRLSLGHMAGNEIINQAGLSYLIMLSSQMVFKSGTILFRSPEVLRLVLEKRSRRAK